MHITLGGEAGVSGNADRSVQAKDPELRPLLEQGLGTYLWCQAAYNNGIFPKEKILITEELFPHLPNHRSLLGEERHWCCPVQLIPCPWMDCLKQPRVIINEQQYLWRGPVSWKNFTKQILTTGRKTVQASLIL